VNEYSKRTEAFQKAFIALKTSVMKFTTNPTEA